MVPIQQLKEPPPPCKELRPAIKMLLNDFYSFERRAAYSNNTLSPHCRFPGCQDQVEDVQHILHCPSTAPVRTTLINQLREVISSSPSNVDLDLVFQNEEVSTQFLLDCSSDNLVVGQRVLKDDPLLSDIFIINRRIINATHCERLKLLSKLTKNLHS